MKNSLVFLLLLSMVLLLALPALGARPQGPARIPFAGKGAGLVDFTHDAHKGYVPDCKTCHHMGVGDGTCVGCHGVISQAPAKRQAFHQSCQGCHETRQVARANDCRFCHKK